MKNTRSSITMAILMTLSLLCFAQRTLSEPYVGGYLGFSSAADSDFTNADIIIGAFNQPNPNNNFLTVFPDADLETDISTSFTFGLRAGYWFDFLPLLGTQFDLYFFNPDIKIPNPNSNQENLDNLFEFDVNVVALGFSILGRYPFFKSPEYPRGRLQPYAGIGPVIFITSWDDQQDTSALDIGSETVVNGGLQFLLGGMFFVRENISVFGEYKFSHHVTQISGSTATVNPNNVNELNTLFSISGNQPFNVSHFTIGVNYHFY